MLSPFVMVEKDPDAELDYTFNWKEWLNGGTLNTVNCAWVTSAANIAIINQSHESTGESTVRVGGGVDGESYEIVNYIENERGEKDNRTLLVTVREK